MVVRGAPSVHGPARPKLGHVEDMADEDEVAQALRRWSPARSEGEVGLGDYELRTSLASLLEEAR